MSQSKVFTPARFNELEELYLPRFMGIIVSEVEEGRVVAELQVEQQHLAPNGYLHAGSVVTLADTACGYGCSASLPEAARGFTTVELKSNFVGTAAVGHRLRCVAQAVHSGRSTQLWDAAVTRVDSERTIALFRCTQMILYPSLSETSQ